MDYSMNRLTLYSLHEIDEVIAWANANDEIDGQYQAPVSGDDIARARHGVA